jgi:predicted mannosyl-3-phosphoglycerate phosphatase (HAD superfamily)
MATPDKHDAGVRIVQCSKLTSVEMLRAFASDAMLSVLVREVLAEVPGADFIEIRAIRIDVKEDNDERTTGTALPGPEGD